MTKTILALGPNGSYGHQVGLNVCALLGDAEIRFCGTNTEILQRFSLGEGDFAITPKSNLRGGRVDHVMDWWLQNNHSGIKIWRALEAVTRHCLVARENYSLGDITEVVSHEQALFQCSKFLKEKGILKNLSVSSTGEAARLISLDEPHSKRRAAICSLFAAEVYGLSLLAENIADLAEGNVTTFHVLSRKENPLDEFEYVSRGVQKTEILFGIEDTPGSLFSLKDVFGVTNIKDIQSFWWKGEKEQQERLITFHLVFEGRNQTLLDNLRERTLWLKVMGTFQSSQIHLF